MALLDTINLSDKTYEEILGESIEKIPMLTDEWTNFNYSDPGITMLQNLSAFTVLQRDTINTVTDAVRLKLLAMLGFESNEYRAAGVYLSANGGLSLMEGEKLMAEDICFEPAGPVELSDWGVNGLYCEYGGEVRDITYVQAGASGTSAAVFGTPARSGAAFYVLLGDVPDERESLTLAVRIMNDEARNPLGDSNLSLATLRWQFFTRRGWEDAYADDGTRGFLKSGFVHLSVKGADKARYTVNGNDGYALRCILTDEAYDLPPRLHSVTANLFKAVQKDSKVSTMPYPGRRTVVLKNRLWINGYYTVYCDEENDGVYRRYEPSTGKDKQGRYYTTKLIPDGVQIRFSPKRFGYSPCTKKNAVRVVCCDAMSAEHLTLGRLMGYEGQTFETKGFSQILPEGFCLLAERQPVNGASEFSFVYPDSTDSGMFRYEAPSSTGHIRVKDPGGMEGCVIHLAGCAVTEGARGNIRAGNVFTPTLMPREEKQAAPQIVNALAASGGSTREDAERLRLRFLADLRTPSVAVTLDDYEYIVRTTPGLCIHKVRAVADSEKNLVRIAVKPYGEDKLPTLSPLYAEYIGRHIDKRRMIGTSIELAPPVYIPINIHAVVYSAGYYEDVRGTIEAFLRGKLDGVNGDMRFGATISYNSLHRRIEALDAVKSLYDFDIAPADWRHAHLEGPDIILGDDELCCPGHFEIEIR
ncbi:MAG: baseplate J/gp47 family protein [Clostridiales Family XIII bacterium]|nr:baseplate J/gp47 family protein [Clostridiales Family XIII bacterium]